MINNKVYAICREDEIEGIIITKAKQKEAIDEICESIHNSWYIDHGYDMVEVIYEIIQIPAKFQSISHLIKYEVVYDKQLKSADLIYNCDFENYPDRPNFSIGKFFKPVKA